MGHNLVYDNNYKFIFVSYVESHDDNNITNDMEELTVSGICRRPTANIQGRYKIWSLLTGHVVTCKHNICEIRMQTWVIRRIDALAALNRWYLFNGEWPLFVDRFSINNVFGIALREGGIVGVAEGNDDDNDNTDEIPEPEPNTEPVVDPNPE